MPITFVYGGAVVPLPDVATHAMALVQMPPMDTASQLRAILPELEWQSAGTMTTLQYADLARITAASLRGRLVE